MSEESSFEFGSEDDIQVGLIRSVIPRFNDSCDSSTVPDDEEGFVHTQKTPKPVLARRKLPILTPNTVNPDTYDLDYLLDPKVQRRAQGSPSQRNPKGINFLKKNIANVKLLRSSKCNRSTSASSRTLTPDLTEVGKLKVAETSELAECTFSPVINRPALHKRSVTQYYESMRTFLQKKQENLDTKRATLASDVSEPTFKPQISGKSQKMKLNRTGSVFTRLQSNHELLIQETIRKRRGSQSMLQSDANAAKKQGAVTERLYRGRNSEPRTAPPRKRSQSPGQNSTRIAFKKFKSELEQAAAGTPDLGNISYVQLRLILERVHMLRPDSDNGLCYQVWSHLTEGKQQLDFSGLKVFLFSVMNFKALSPRIHSEFQTLYLTRLSTVNSHQEDVPVKSSKSTTLAAQKEHLERLLQSSDILTKKLEAAKLAQEKEMLKNCTFLPAIVSTVPRQRGVTVCDSLATDYQKLLNLNSQSRHSNLHKLADIIRERQLATKVPEKVDPECTFTPQLLKRRNSSQEIMLQSSAVRAAERMTKAREESEWKEYCKMQGLNNTKVTQIRKRKQWSASRKRSASMSASIVE